MKKTLHPVWAWGILPIPRKGYTSKNKYMSQYINSVTNEDLAQAGVRSSARHHSYDEDINDDLLEALRGAVGYVEMEGGYCTPPYWYTRAKNAIDKIEGRIK